MQDNFKEKSLFQLESLGLEKLPEFSPSMTGQTQKFVSPDGKLQIEYPAEFSAIGEKETLQGLTPESWAAKYNLETIFFAAKMQGEGLAQLIVYEGNFDLTIPDIVNEMKKLNQEQGLQMEVVSSDFQAKEGVFEAKYQTKQGYAIHSQEKILAGEGNEFFLISGLAAESDWLAAKPAIDKILNSAIIIE